MNLQNGGDKGTARCFALSKTCHPDLSSYFPNSFSETIRKV